MSNFKLTNAEKFFIDSLNTDKLFFAIQRTDFLYLLYIGICQNEDESKKIYLSQISEDLNQSIPNVSKAMEKLQDRGLISWKFDDKVGRTYVELTNTAIEIILDQRKKMTEIYEKITEEFSTEELLTTGRVMARIRDLTEQ